MTSTDFAVWMLRSMALAGAALLAHRACPAGRASRVALPLLGFAGLLVLTVHQYLHGPQFSLPDALSLPGTWPHSSVITTPISSHWLIVTWLAVGAFLLVRDALGAWRLRTIIRASQLLTERDWLEMLDECRARLGLFHASVELRLSPGIGPAAAGVQRRVILLPPECVDWPAAQRRFILLHELAHFRHGDLTARIFARAVCALQWFNPFAWALARRLDLDCETSCDAAVVSHTAAPRAYAEILLAFTESSVAPPHLAFGFGARRHSTLETRILRVLHPAAISSGWRGRFGMIFGLAMLLTTAVLCACSWIQPAIPSDEVRLRLTADPFPGEH